MNDNQYTMTPTLTPILIAGTAMKAMPSWQLLKPPLAILALIINRKHPGIVKRMASFGDIDILFDPIDLPIGFISHFRQGKMSISVIEYPFEKHHAHAIIHGTLIALCQLAEGKVDGDALFFTRELTIEKDTEIVVALRNALEAENINLVDDILKPLGRFSKPASFFVDQIKGVFSRANNDFENLTKALLQPIQKNQEKQTAEIKRLNDQVATLNNQQTKLKNIIKKLRTETKEA